MLLNPYRFAAGAGIVVDAADFDAANDYGNKAGFTGTLADSKTGIFSGWFRFDSVAAATAHGLFYNLTSSGAGILICGMAIAGVDGIIRIEGRNDLNGIILRMENATALSTGTWYHLLASWDLAAAAGHLLIDGTNDLNTGTDILTNDNINYKTMDSGSSGLNFVGSGNAGGIKFDGCMAELYFQIGQYLDFSSAANVQKFRTAGGKPENLGVTGATPTGSQPLVYLHLDNGETANNFFLNAGSGGNYTVNGALATCASSPSD